MQTARNELKIKEFIGADEEWFDYVINNRNGIDLFHDSDMIIGSVANDDVYRVVDDYENELISKEMAIAALKVKKLFNQYAMKTETAKKHLKFAFSEFFREAE